MLGKSTFHTSARQLPYIDKSFHMTTSSSEWRQESLGSIQNLITWRNAQLAIEKAVCSADITMDELVTQLRQKEIDRKLCLGQTAEVSKEVDTGDIQVRQEHKGMCSAEHMWLTTSKARNSCLDILVGIRDYLSDYGSSIDDEDGEDEDNEEKKLCKLSEGVQPGCVLGSLSDMVPQHLERIQHKQMRLERLPQLLWGNAADIFHDRDNKQRRAWMRVPAVVKRQTISNADTLLLTAFQHRQNVIRSGTHTETYQSLR